MREERVGAGIIAVQSQRLYRSCSSTYQLVARNPVTLHDFVRAIPSTLVMSADKIFSNYPGLNDA